MTITKRIDDRTWRVFRHCSDSQIALALDVPIEVVKTKRAGLESLTARQFEAVKLVAMGYTNEEIAGAMGIGDRTVQTLLSQILHRWRIDTRTEAAVLAVLSGVADSDDCLNAIQDRQRRRVDH